MSAHTAFRDLVYEEMERQQRLLDKYFIEDLEGEDENDEE